MKIRFADRLPDGDFAHVIPAAGPDAPSITGLGAQVRAALINQRFDGEAGSAVEHYHEIRRILVVGMGKGAPSESAEKIGGTAVTRLLTSGERSRQSTSAGSTSTPIRPRGSASRRRSGRGATITIGPK